MFAYRRSRSVPVCVNENDRENECYTEMNERNDFYISKSRYKKKRQNQSVALDVDSVAPRHTMVYVWETLRCC